MAKIGWAARYSSHIDLDLQRGWSRVFGYEPDESKDALREVLISEGWNYADLAQYIIVKDRKLGGYSLAFPGLAAWWGKDKKEVIKRALQEHRFRDSGLRLYVFRAEYVMDDPTDMDNEVVTPKGPPEEIAYV